MNKAVQLVILIRMRTPSSQLRLVEFRQRRWVGSIRNTEDIIHGIVTKPVLHHSLTVRCKVHRLQTFTLLVVGDEPYSGWWKTGIVMMPWIISSVLRMLPTQHRFLLQNNRYYGIFIFYKEKYQVF